jgi:hypothetical protein
MSASMNLIRWGGLAAILGGALWISLLALATMILLATGEAWSETHQPIPYRFGGIVFELALMLVAMGLVGLRARLGARSPWLVTAGLVLACIAIVAMVVNLPLGTEALGGIGLLGLFGGAILLGIATLRANVLPRWARALPLAFGVLGAPIVIGVAAVGGFLFPAYADTELTQEMGIVILGAAAIVLGYAIRKGGREEASQLSTNTAETPSYSRS